MQISFFHIIFLNHAHNQSLVCVSRECDIFCRKHAWGYSQTKFPGVRGTPFGQHQESRPMARSNIGSPRFTDFPSLCACLESSLTNLIGSGLNLFCLYIHSKPECRWTWPEPEVAILGADQKECGLLDENAAYCKVFSPFFDLPFFSYDT